MKVIGYTYEADYHCVDCTEKRFRQTVSRIGHGMRDNEGNPIHPIFSTDEQLETPYCGDCFNKID